jgi:hypothetical protein
MTKSCALLNFDRLYVTSYDAIWKKDGKQIWVRVQYFSFFSVIDLSEKFQKMFFLNSLKLKY